MSADTLNQALVITAKTMYKEGYITKDQYVEFVSTYMIVPNTPGFLSRLMRKIRGRDGDEESKRTYYDMVKIVHSDDHEDDWEFATLGQARTEAKKKATLQKTVRTDRFSSITDD